MQVTHVTLARNGYSSKTVQQTGPFQLADSDPSFKTKLTWTVSLVFINPQDAGKNIF